MARPAELALQTVAYKSWRRRTTPQAIDDLAGDVRSSLAAAGRHHSGHIVHRLKHLRRPEPFEASVRPHAIYCQRPPMKHTRATKAAPLRRDRFARRCPVIR